MKLKGSATIELTNADGSKEVIKHDNMITNAPADLLTTVRGEMPPLFQIADNGASYAQTMFGGILLFDETLNDDPADYYFPSANVTGYASQDAYAGLDFARGSFNQSEGGVQEDGSYKFVWDFATSQANGNIKSIALCPNMMGQIGASVSIVDRERKDFYVKNNPANPFEPNGYTFKGKSIDGIGDYYFRVLAVIDDIAYAYEERNIFYVDETKDRFILNNGGKLKLYKFRIGVKSISVCDNIGNARYIGYDEIQLPTEFTDTLSSASNSTTIFYNYNYSNGKLAVFPSCIKSDVAPKGTMKYVEIDLKNNYDVKTYTFTNNTVGTIKKEIGYIYAHRAAKTNFFVGSKYIVVVAYISDTAKNKIYVINRDDNTDVKEVKWKNGNEFSMANNYYVFPAFVLGDNILVFNGTYDLNYARNYYILDLKTGKLVKTNATGMSDVVNVDIGNKAAFARTGTYLGFRTIVNPFILCTKNNLDTPIVKTASQTMKITYTLSEVADESASGGAGDSGTSSGTTSGGTSTSDTSEEDNKTVTENNNNGGA